MLSSSLKPLRLNEGVLNYHVSLQTFQIFSFQPPYSLSISYIFPLHSIFFSIHFRVLLLSYIQQNQFSFFLSLCKKQENQLSYMASSTGFKIFLLLALFITSCIAQSPVPAPKISPTASPTPTPAPEMSPPTPTPTTSPTPTLGPSPSSLPVSPSSPTPAGPGASPPGQPVADVPPAPSSSNRAVFGGAAFVGALIAVALM